MFPNDDTCVTKMEYSEEEISAVVTESRQAQKQMQKLVKAVVKYVGGFWPIGVFFAGYRSFFFVPSRQTQTKARL